MQSWRAPCTPSASSTSIPLSSAPLPAAPRRALQTVASPGSTSASPVSTPTPKRLLVSSSKYQTVRLWDITASTCLKTFSHTDYAFWARAVVGVEIAIAGGFQRCLNGAVPGEQEEPVLLLHHTPSTKCHMSSGRKEELEASKEEWRSMLSA